ncbi:MAG: hypothetical protein IJW78_04915 [Clostridia bacterium]|nr:hypothetical protein [Clostridia bacterium]
MKILYKGLETFEFTYGGEYDVIRSIPRPYGETIYICIDNLGDESPVSSHCSIVL